MTQYSFVPVDSYDQGGYLNLLDMTKDQTYQLSRREHGFLNVASFNAVFVGETVVLLISAGDWLCDNVSRGRDERISGIMRQAWIDGQAWFSSFPELLAGSRAWPGTSSPFLG